MAVLLPHSVFFHIGRTAGYWVRDALIALDLHKGEIGGFHENPLRLDHRPEVKNRPFHFCFTRHPLEWLRSTYLHRKMYATGKDLDHGAAEAESFTEFLEYLLAENEEGYVSLCHAPYLSGCHFVGRQENLAEDLCRALFKAGESFDGQIIRRVPHTNESSPYLLAFAKAPRALLEKIMARERPLFGPLGYENVPEKMVDETAPLFCPTAPFLTLKHFPADSWPSASSKAPPTLAKAAAIDENAAPETLRRLLENAVSAGEQEILLTVIKDRLAHYLPTHSAAITPSLHLQGTEPLHNTLLMLNAMEGLNLKGKRVLHYGCEDAMLAFHAARLGAREVVAVDARQDRLGPEFLQRFLNAPVQFISRHPLSLTPENLGGRFDVILVYKKLNQTPYPALHLRTLQSLLQPAGDILLQTMVYDAENCFLPMLLCLKPQHGPITDEEGECSFYTPAGLEESLALFGLTVTERLLNRQLGLPNRNFYDRFGIKGEVIRELRQSPFHQIIWRLGHAPDAATNDFEAQKNKAYRQFFDEGIPLWLRSGPVSADAEELARRLIFLEAQKTEDKLQRKKAEQGQEDRIQELEKLRHEHEERTNVLTREIENRDAELVALRELLVERTTLLETELADRTRRLEDALRRLPSPATDGNEKDTAG